MRYLVAVLLIGSVLPLCGQPTTWTGNESLFWSAPGNWDSGVPSSSTGAVINATGASISLDTAGQAASLALSNAAVQIANSGTLQLGQSQPELSGAQLALGYDGSLTLDNYATLTLSGSGTATNAGSILVQSGAQAMLAGFTNTGSFGVYGNSYAGTGDGLGTVTVSGPTFNLNNGYLHVAGGGFTSDGLLTNGGDSSYPSLLVEAGGQMALNAGLDNSGWFQVNGTGSALTVQGDAVNHQSYFGVIDGAQATVTGNLVNNGDAAVASSYGTAISTLLVNGDFVNGGSEHSGTATIANSQAVVYGSVLNQSGSNLLVTDDGSGPGQLMATHLINDGTLTVDNHSVLHAYDAVNTGTADSPAVLSVQNNSLMTAAALTNAGEVYVSGDGSMLVSDFSNNGNALLSIGGNDSNGSNVTVSGRFDNQGSVVVQGAYGFGMASLEYGESVLDLRGTTDLTSNFQSLGEGQLRLAGGSWQVYSGGTILQNQGDVTEIGSGTSVYLSGGRILNDMGEGVTDITETLRTNNGFLQVDNGTEAWFTSGSLLNGSTGVLTVGGTEDYDGSRAIVTGAFENQGSVVVRGASGGCCYGRASNDLGDYGVSVLDLTDAEGGEHSERPFDGRKLAGFPERRHRARCGRHQRDRQRSVGLSLRRSDSERAIRRRRDDHGYHRNSYDE